MLNSTQISKAILDLKNDEVIILPTDTIYGLSALWNKTNEVKINKLKNATNNKPLIVLISDIKQLDGMHIVENKAKDLLFEKLTTVIFKMNNDSQTIAVRLIEREDIKTIIDEVGPIFSTSVNKHGDKALNKKEELLNFNLNLNVYFDSEVTNTKPSKIYNSITDEWIR
ncbi:L-threonylcarbamoyladenylate synthase [Mesoplasma melaleucae]|uniref:L-threonylcarbamoyladenylate synthase n=1 Tax=Mesoplasma melaleucae TaxID=81459 RepID=A0A2K8NWX9_9MOLU|nr:Sua5/YciO/YrdC/YwlC family protein [Mesoplasma melaleucae]ATZ18340.1 tRNA threonylcarbamoyladenosine biosynthesis protein [Mesoplasma melaleucae]